VARRVGRLPADTAARRALEAYGPDRKARGSLEIATVRAIPNLSAKARYVRDLVLPGRDFVRARGPDRWRRPLRWIRWTEGRDG
jgi:hypothetical protein